jgi:hypothetical protein
MWHSEPPENGFVVKFILSGSSLSLSNRLCPKWEGGNVSFWGF